MRRASNEDWDTLWVEITDTFSPGPPIEERDLFAGRANELQKLLDATFQRGKHAIVFGERGVGKTSLVNILQLVLRTYRDVHYVRVNARPEDTFTSIWTNVFKRLTYEFGPGQTRRIADDYPHGFTADDVQLELGNTSAQQLIVVLDEFDRISDRAVTVQVADTIKALSDYSLNVTIVISGVAEDVTHLIEGHESISRSIIQVKMPRMSLDELGELIMKRYKKLGMDIDGDGLWKIIFLARGLPFYAHQLGMHAARIAVKRHSLRITVKDVDDALSVALSEVDQLLKERYYSAVISQRGDALYADVLLACALAQSDELGRFQQSSVAGPLNKILPGKNYRATTYAFHMNAMATDERKNVLVRLGDENVRYRFSDPMMQPFVILKGLADGRIDDTIAGIYVSRRQLLLSI